MTPRIQSSMDCSGILPCPKCGLKPRIYHSLYGSLYGNSVECDRCSLPELDVTNWQYTTWDEAVSRWNRLVQRTEIEGKIMTIGMKAIWYAQYHASRLLLWAALFVMPPGAYRAELRKRVYDLKYEAIEQAAYKASPELRAAYEHYIKNQPKE